ncbi:hypothetical protein KA005_73995, partial [bacterium]|nr:hypothetical protein [bacterium]
MKILIQWALKNPKDWVEIDSSEWINLPKKSIKKAGQKAGQKIDNKKGWIFDLNIQGLHFSPHEHYAVEDLNNDEIRVTAWSNHLGKYNYAKVVTILPLAPDKNLGGAINTRQTVIFYAAPEKFKELKALNFVDAEVRPWEEFVPPSQKVTRHGIWVTDDDEVNPKIKKHIKAQTRHGWHEWTEGLARNEIRNGCVKCQRDLGRYKRADGTITFIQRGTDGGGGAGDDADSNCTPAVGYNYKLTLNSTTQHNVIRDVPKNTDNEITFAFTTEPGPVEGGVYDADWPSGNYRAQIDCEGLENGDLSFTIQLLRVNNACTIQETLGTSGSYTTTGNHLYS